MIGRIILIIFLVSFGAEAHAANCNGGGRYEDFDDGTVQDCRTGLIWLQNANCTDSLGVLVIDKSNGILNWFDALTWVAALSSGHCGLTDGSSAGDWRLPTKTEWMAMVACAKKLGFTSPTLTNAAGTGQWTSGDLFTNVQSNYHWSSTAYAADTSEAWGVDMVSGPMFHLNKVLNLFVRPVRDGQSGEFGSISIQ